MRPALLLIAAFAAALSAACSRSGNDEALVVYSSRNDQLIKPVIDRYQADTGAQVRYLTDSDAALLARLEAEGAGSPADVLLTVDAGNLWRAAELGLLQPMDSAVLRDHIPEQYRDEDLRWVGLSLRARTVIYSTERVDPAELSDYAALAEPEWRGRLCLRTSKKVYNQSLVAMMIARNGVEDTEAMVRGWVANLAAEPFANDTALIEAIAAGQCDVGIVNTYYFGRVQRDNPDVPVAVFWPGQSGDGHGVHVNVSGAGITAASKRPELAQRFIEWLSERDAQTLFAEMNMEYPVDSQAPVAPVVAAWGEFRADTTPLAEAGRLQAEAVRLMDRAGYR